MTNLSLWTRWLPRCGLGLIGLMAFGLSSVQAQETAGTAIGFVKTVQAPASLVVAGKSTVAEPGMAVQMGQTLKTGPNGSMGVTFRDNTIMSFGPNTEIVVDEYLYAPGKGDLKLGATLSKGTLHYVSGIIAKLKPEAVTVKTPVGLIGVRGTRYVALVEEGTP